MRTVREIEREIENERAKWRRVVEPLEKELKDARLNEYGVKVGDVIEHGGMKYKVAGLEYVWVAAHPMKKDGSWSKVTKNLYSFKGGA